MHQKDPLRREPEPRAFLPRVLLAWRLGHQTDQLLQVRMLLVRELPAHQTDRRRELLVVRLGQGLLCQMGQQPERPRVHHQTDQPPEQDRWELGQVCVFQCRQELRVRAMEQCGASRLRFRERVRSGVASPVADFGTTRREPWPDTFRGLVACFLECVPGCGRRGRSRWCRWLRVPSLFRNRPELRVRGRASSRSTRGNSTHADRRCRH